MTITPETRRQVVLYTDVVDVYEAVELEIGVDKRLANHAAGKVSDTPTYTDQPCKRFSSSEYNQANAPIGRTLQDNMLTLDRYHFPLGVELKDGAVIHHKTSGDPDSGAYFRVVGNSETWVGGRTRKAKYARVFCKRIPIPAELGPA